MSKNIAKTLVATAQALAKASEDLAKIAKELTPKEPETFSSVAQQCNQNLVFTNRFYEACHRKGLNPRIQIGHVNTFILGMSKKEYMLKNDIDEPFNDNAPEDIIWLKNGALRAATLAIMDSGDKITNAQGKVLMKGICDYVLKHSSAKTIERVASALREKPSWVKAASED